MTRRSTTRSAAVAEDNGSAAAPPRARAKRGKAAARTTTAEERDHGNPEGEGRSSSSNSNSNYWLMKAEPESRVEKGRDVKFSIEDLAASKEPQGWDGGTYVRVVLFPFRAETDGE